MTADAQAPGRKHRRRMRGIATFFIVIALIGGAGSLILFGVENQRVSAEDALGRAIVSFGLLCAALGTWNGSRIAALFLFAILIATPIFALTGAVDMKTTDWVRSGVYVTLSIIMLVSAFQYHSEVRKSGDALAGRGWLRWTGKSLAGLVIVFLGFGVSILVFGPATGIIKADEITTEQSEWLTAQGFLTEQERPIFLYFDGLFNFEDGGSFLTDTYVGGWWQEEGEINSYWIELGQICKVEILQRGSTTQDAIYQVYEPGEDSWVQLWLSIEDNLHHDFIARMTTLNSRKTRPEIQKFCDENRPVDWAEIAAMNDISQDIVEADGITDAQRQWLTEQNYLVGNEEILNFYSFGKFSISEEGILLTDEYFGGWYEKNDDLTGWWMKLGVLCDITAPDDANTSETAFYRATDTDGGWSEFRLPTRNGQADALVSRILALNAERVTDENQDACQSLASAE
ncbi:MAG: hypothetical protein AAFZ74_04925 [Pseudomonadota bacterium]